MKNPNDFFRRRILSLEHQLALTQDRAQHASATAPIKRSCEKHRANLLASVGRAVAAQLDRLQGQHRQVCAQRDAIPGELTARGKPIFDEARAFEVHGVGGTRYETLRRQIADLTRRASKEDKRLAGIIKRIEFDAAKLQAASGRGTVAR